ncbi:hypothetical protein T190607A02C_20498 [Tenacibaculum sp. 190524A02b]
MYYTFYKLSIKFDILFCNASDAGTKGNLTTSDVIFSFFNTDLIPAGLFSSKI